jgi:hypothetical protein
VLHLIERRSAHRTALPTRYHKAQRTMQLRQVLFCQRTGHLFRQAKPRDTDASPHPEMQDFVAREKKLWESFPVALRQALLRVDEQRKLAGSPWLPRHVEVMFWPYEYAPDEAIIWPRDWPGLRSKGTKTRGEGSYSVYLPSAKLVALRILGLFAYISERSALSPLRYLSWLSPARYQSGLWEAGFTGPAFSALSYLTFGGVFLLLANRVFNLPAHALLVLRLRELAGAKLTARLADLGGLRERADGGGGKRGQREDSRLHGRSHRIRRLALPEVALKPHARNFFCEQLDPGGPVTYLRLNVIPDGGMSRVRVWGLRDA